MVMFKYLLEESMFIGFLGASCIYFLNLNFYIYSGVRTNGLLISPLGLHRGSNPPYLLGCND